MDLSKRATVRESHLISLKKSDVRDLLVIREKTSDSLGKKCIFCRFFTAFPPLYAKRANHSSCSSLFFKDQQDGFALVTPYKRATVSKLIPSFFKKERREQIDIFANLQQFSKFFMGYEKGRQSQDTVLLNLYHDARKISRALAFLIFDFPAQYLQYV